ncbi:MAG: GTPase [Candidatus Methanomethylophilaceae archaeon]|nr:GTPase [Thermoplasmata archaeon]MBQ2762125.1 GTPase [Candidatus Methanomethylophilaceae archaeon]
MIIHIVGGFLGSGKTTLLIKMAERYMDSGRKVAILVNEIGEIGVDGATISGSGLKTVELAEGCICCSLSGSLQSTMKEIESTINPDVLIIEPTGLALPHKVVEIIRGTVVEDHVSIIGICDAMRFETLREKKEEFLRMQLSKSEHLLINKVDVADFEKVFEVSSWLRQICPGVPIFMVSGKTGEGLDEAFAQALLV